MLKRLKQPQSQVIDKCSDNGKKTTWWFSDSSKVITLYPLKDILKFVGIAIVLFAVIIFGISKLVNSKKPKDKDVSTSIVATESETSESSKTPSSSVDLPKEITLNDGKQTKLKQFINLSDYEEYRNQIISLLEEHYKCEVENVYLFSAISGSTTIQFLIWFDSSDSENYNMTQFASASITKFLLGKTSEIKCGTFKAGNSGGFIIYEE